MRTLRTLHAWTQQVKQKVYWNSKRKSNKNILNDVEPLHESQNGPLQMSIKFYLFYHFLKIINTQRWENTRVFVGGASAYG